ncbi:MAG: 2-oxoacid:acceptor oxidoreductase subunit alpha [Acidobacteriota bacterium]
MKNRNLVFIQGNEACAEGALLAGVRFFAGYPITPSTEIAEEMAKKLPAFGGRFIQMEDEIASVAAICGASEAGVKSMTATSGPGFSLMQENIGYAYFTEIPIVIVNVQRGGPSTGLPTKVSQSDTMQARWGTHGDYTAIAVAPNSVRDSLYQTIRAVNLAEKYRTPVIVLLDEVLGHMREKIEIPDESEVEIINRTRPTVSRDDFIPYGNNETGVNPFPIFGSGYRTHVTGLTHDIHGFPTSNPPEVAALLSRLRRKIDSDAKSMMEFEEEMLDDAEIAFVAYGIVARAARQAVLIGRKQGKKLGLLTLKTIWPFPDEKVSKLLTHVDSIIVPELNMGQIILEVERINRNGKQILGVNKFDGEILSPIEILAKAEEIR